MVDCVMSTFAGSGAAVRREENLRNSKRVQEFFPQPRTREILAFYVKIFQLRVDISSEKSQRELLASFFLETYRRKKSE